MNCSNNGASSTSSNSASLGGACAASQGSRNQKSLLSNFLKVETPTSIGESIIICLLQLSVVVTMLVAFNSTLSHPDSNQLSSEILTQPTTLHLDK
ncbi:hypothetical protein LC613_23980 [Nostoc sphaeroides CHAB 2801]|uniref:hypothetical protein n=1 Tax=Nostoc sphaeroides TaxID=446679 RepID=UPI000E4BFE63|nr:hypothetical protein [Nostoc sphaeroides]MCC5630885.1 hypothetical protein [Nostoc sphaeroides CHAB 2801]